jgi:hypothetical protein
MGYDEFTDPTEGKQVLANGDYLCVKYWEHPIHVYKRVQSGQQLHPFTDRMEHNGQLYGLAWIEDDKV